MSIPMRKALVKKKHPIGTPAFPIAAHVAKNIQPIKSNGPNSTPLSVETNNTVIKMKAAHPFMLMTEQSGSEKCETLLDMPRLFSTARIAKGSVALDDFVKKATVRG